MVIGKIIFAVWIIVETLLHIKFWGKKMSIRRVGFGTICRDLLDVAIFASIMIWW
jgi:hypothetical protein